MNEIVWLRERFKFVIGKMRDLVFDDFCFFCEVGVVIIWGEVVGDLRVRMEVGNSWGGKRECYLL